MGAHSDQDQNIPERAPHRTEERKVRLSFLDGLRGIAALQVVFHHYVGLHLGELPGLLRFTLIWTHGGHFAVDLFIVISGYCLMLPVVSPARRSNEFDTLQFFKRRWRRILPPYYAALLLSLIVLSFLPPGSRPPDWSHDFDRANITAHLILVHNLNPGWHSSINMAFWSIATEWQIYWFFPLLLLPVWRRFGNWTALGVGFAAGLAPHYLLPRSMNIDRAMPWYIGLFSLGMVGAAINAAGLNLKGREARLLLWIALWLLGLYGYLKYLQPTFSSALGSLEWLKDTTMGILATASIVMLAHLAARDDSFPKPAVLRALESKRLLWLGTLSYSLYLTHCVVLEILNAIVRSQHLSGVAALLLRTGVGIPAAMLVAYGMYWAVESRCVRRSPQAHGKPIPLAVHQRS